MNVRYCRKGRDISPTSRHVGLYYWCAYWRHWDKVLAVNGTWWKVVKCGLDGQPVEEPRMHWTPMNSCAFADKPFPVERNWR